MVEKQSNTDKSIQALTSEAAARERPAEAPAELAATAASISRPQRYYHGSGHLIDAGLQTEYNAEKTQGILFPEILRLQLRKTKEEIVADKPGFQYSEAEFLLKHTLMEILWETRSNDGSFGNQQPLNNKPVLAIGAYELAQRRFFGKGKIGGRELKDIHATIHQLHQKTFWIQRSYIEEPPPSKNKRARGKRPIVKRHTHYSAVKLFDLAIGHKGDDSSQIEPSLSTVTKGTKFIFAFDPIFVQDVAAWYVRFPTNWTEIVRRAFGDHAGIKPYRMAELLFQLHAYQSKNPDRPYQEIDRDHLLHKIGMADELKSGRRSRIDTALKKLFAVFSNEPLRLLADVQILKGAKAQEKIRFFLNSSFFEQPLPQNLKEGGGA